MDCYQDRGIRLKGGERSGYTIEDLNYYYGEWIENPLENVDLTEDRDDYDYDEDDPGMRARVKANSDFVRHAKKRELKDFHNKEEYSYYLSSLRSLVFAARYGMLGHLVYYSNDNWDDMD